LLKELIGLFAYVALAGFALQHAIVTENCRVVAARHNRTPPRAA
jgi:hypothetical protein